MTYTAVFIVTAISIERAAYWGLPCAVKHAESVCTQDSVSALIEKILTSLTSVANSSPERDRKIILTAGFAKRYNPTALGNPTAAVTASEKKSFFLGCLDDATAGTLAAAMP